MSLSEQILDRYKKIEKEADSLGRVISVRRLRPSEQMKVTEFTLSEKAETKAVFSLAAAVCSINDLPVPFPRTRAELDSVLDTLDEEGIVAAVAAVTRLMGISGDPATGAEALEAAKKSAGTPSSGTQST